jgi:hypothetical protein
VIFYADEVSTAYAYLSPSTIASLLSKFLKKLNVKAEGISQEEQLTLLIIYCCDVFKTINCQGKYAITNA